MLACVRGKANVLCDGTYENESPPPREAPIADREGAAFWEDSVSLLVPNNKAAPPWLLAAPAPLPPGTTVAGVRALVDDTVGVESVGAECACEEGGGGDGDAVGDAKYDCAFGSTKASNEGGGFDKALVSSKNSDENMSLLGDGERIRRKKAATLPRPAAGGTCIQ